MGWLSGWQYRKKHEINGSSAGAVTDYQIRVKVHYGSGTDSGEDVYLNSKCRSDFGDVRFTKDDGETVLDYWMEEKVDGDYAVFWVKVPSIPASPNKATIYIYYGKSDATYAGDGDDTFPFFDDFPGTSLDTTKWEGGGAIEISDSILHYHGNGTYQMIRAKDAYGFSQNVACRFKAKYHNPNYYDVNVGLCDATDYSGRPTKKSNNYVLFIVAGDPDKRDERLGNRKDGTSATVVLRSEVQDTWFTWELRWLSSKTILEVMGGSSVENTSYVPSATLYPCIGCEHYTYDAEIWVDWIFVRKYVDPEPSHGTWYAEEEQKVTLSGKVQLPDGTAVANATIIVIDEETNEILATTTSASDGTWSVEISPGKTVTVVAIPQESDYGGDAKPHIAS